MNELIIFIRRLSFRVWSLAHCVLSVYVIIAIVFTLNRRETYL